MFNLYKTDLKRILRDKLFLISCIIAAAFALITPLLNVLLFSLLAQVDAGMLAEIGLDAKSTFFSSFAPGSNLGLIAPVLLCIIVCKDFSYGTIRNKVISGKSRISIFFSLYLAFATVLFALILFHAVLTLAVSLIFFEYQSTPFTAGDIGYLFASIGLEILVYCFIAALCAFLCVSMKNAGLAVVLYVAANFLFTIIGTIISMAGMFINPAQKTLIDILQFLDHANIFMGSYIGIVPTYDIGGLLSVLVGTVGLGALFIMLGLLVFRKKDLK